MVFNHVNIKASFHLIQEEKQFYCDVLKLEEGFRPQFSFRGFWIYAGGKPIVHLAEKDSSDLVENAGYIDHLAFQSSLKLDHFIKHIEKLGVEYRMSYIDEIATTQVFLKSPLGIKIEIVFVEKS